MLLVAPEELAVVESRLPSLTSQLGPPSYVLDQIKLFSNFYRTRSNCIVRINY
jgi:hypothetical protein